MSTKKYASAKLNKYEKRYNKKNPVGSKMVKRAQRHNLDGTNQTSLITRTFNMLKQDAAEVKRLN